MTVWKSAQLRSRLHHRFQLTSSLPIFKWLYLAMCKILAPIFLWFVFLEIRLVNINSDSLSFFSLCSFQQRMFCLRRFFISKHHNDVTIGAMASQLTSLTTIYPTVYSGADQGKHQSSASLAFVRGIHRWPVNSPHNGPVTQKMFPFHDVIMGTQSSELYQKQSQWLPMDN